MGLEHVCPVPRGVSCSTLAALWQQTWFNWVYLAVCLFFILFPSFENFFSILKRMKYVQVWDQITGFLWVFHTSALRLAFTPWWEHHTRLPQIKRKKSSCCVELRGKTVITAAVYGNASVLFVVRCRIMRWLKTQHGGKRSRQLQPLSNCSALQ